MIAVNVGGAVIPVAITAFLILSSGLSAALGTGFAAAVTAAFTNRAAKQVRGVGIVVPTVLPGLVSAASAVFCTLVLGLEPAAMPQVAFGGGVVGALVGADLLNMDEIACLGAPVVSIGGAGTFDGVLISGVTAVLLGSIPVPA